MSTVALVLVVILAGAVAWLAYEVLRLRQGSDARGSLAGADLDSLQREVDSLRETVLSHEDLLRSLEDSLAQTIQRVGVVNYDAYGDIAGALSCSIALVDPQGTGVIITQLIGRNDSHLYVKGVVQGEGEDQLSPEETEAVQRALGMG